MVEHEQQLPGLVRSFQAIWGASGTSAVQIREDDGWIAVRIRDAPPKLIEGRITAELHSSFVVRHSSGELMSKRTPTPAAYTLHRRGFDSRLPQARGSSSAGRACSHYSAATTRTLAARRPGAGRHPSGYCLLLAGAGRRRGAGDNQRAYSNAAFSATCMRPISGIKGRTLTGSTYTWHPPVKGTGSNPGIGAAKPPPGVCAAGRMPHLVARRR